jgi:2'-5' RNA ligase
VTRRGETGSETVRAFVALELPAELRAGLAAAGASLRERLAGARFVAPEGIHLTLRFLGPSRPDQLAALRPALAAAARACPALDTRAAGLGTFPPRGTPRVLWLGLEAPPELGVLQAACEAAARALGFEPERRPFSPHLTLARWRDRAPRPELPPLDLGAARLETLTLFRSELRPEGARYTALERFPLGTGATA